MVIAAMTSRWVSCQIVCLEVWRYNTIRPTCPKVSHPDY